MRFRSKTIAGLAIAAASITTLVACSSSSSGSSSSASTAGTPVTGGTATWAEPPSDTPNYIFPFTSSAYISVSNIDQFRS